MEAEAPYNTAPSGRIHRYCGPPIVTRTTRHARFVPMTYFRSSHWLPWLAFVMTVTLFIDVLLVLSGVTPGVRQMSAPLAGVLVTTLTGALLLDLAGTTAVAALPAALVVGAGVLMSVLLLLAVLLDVTAQTAFLIWTACLVMVMVAIPRFRRWRPAPSSWTDVGATVCLAALIGFFCRDMAAFMPAALHNAPMPAWSDYFVHGTNIASFGDPLAIKEGNILLANTRRPLYHYGSYLLAGALQPSSGLSGLGLALATMQPQSLLIGALGLYALIAQLSGRAIALIAVLCIACLPGPSRYWMQNGFYDFHWLLYAAPGSGYAIGVGMASALCVQEGGRAKRLGPHLLGLLLLLSISMIRLHMFALLAPALAGTWAIIVWRAPVRRKWPVVLGCFALVLAAAVALLAWRSDLRELFHSVQYVKDVLAFGPPRFQAFYHQQEGWMPMALQLVLVLALALVFGLAGFAVILPVVVFLWVRARRWAEFDWFPWALCGTYVLLILLGPTWLNTDASELKHRHFLLLYAAVGSWCVARALQLVTVVAWDQAKVERVALLVFALTISLVMIGGHRAEPGHPMVRYMPWAGTFYKSPNEPGLAQAGAYIHSHAVPGDLLMMGGQAMRGYIMSRQTELVSLADVAAYVGRVELLEKQTGPMADVAATRSAAVARVEAATSWPEACRRMREVGVRWYAENRQGLPQWDTGREHAAMNSGDFAVYDAGTRDQDRCATL